MSLLRFAWRQIWKGAAIWSAVMAVLVVVGVQAFTTAYPGEAARVAFARSLGRLPAFQALYGQAVRVDTAGGFVTWRYGDFMTLIVGVWALLAVTRMIRGDEDTGRADVLVAAPITPRRLMGVELAAVGAGCALVLVVVAASAAASGLPVGGAVLFGFTVAAGGLVFGAVAAATSQLFGTRRRAAGWAGAVVGASYLLRALADGSSRLHWLGWLTPLGWTERVRPFTGADGRPVLVVVGASAVLVAVALALRESRDTGAAVLGERAGRRGPRSMTSPLALDWHLSTGALVGWASGMLVGLFSLGYLTKDVVTFASENPSIDRLVRQIYGYSMASPSGFLSISFTVVAIVLAAYAGSHLFAAREEEADGRAEHLLVAGTSRVRWLAQRLVVAVVAMVALALVGAVGAWAGVNASGESIGLLGAVKGSLNVLPPALLFGGIAVLAFGAVPRATVYVAFGTITAAYLVQVVAGLAHAPGWLVGLSPFSHLAPVPAAPVDAVATLVMLAIAGTTTAVGVLAFDRRDIALD